MQDGDFNFVETDAPTPGDGEVLVRNLILSCDPTQRGRIARELISAGGQDRRSRPLDRRRSDRSFEQSRLRSRRYRVGAYRLAGLCRDEPEGPTQ